MTWIRVDGSELSATSSELTGAAGAYAEVATDLAAACDCAMPPALGGTVDATIGQLRTILEEIPALGLGMIGGSTGPSGISFVPGPNPLVALQPSGRGVMTTDALGAMALNQLLHRDVQVAGQVAAATASPLYKPESAFPSHADYTDYNGLPD